MDVSIIIVNYKQPDLVMDCVRSIEQQTQGISYEVLVVDNGSEDGSLERFRRELGGRARVIDAGANLGFGRANNLGAGYARGEYLFLLNSDTLLLNNAVKILADYLKANPTVGVAGGNLYDREGRPSGSYCEAFDDLDAVRRAAAWSSILGSIAKRRRRDRIQDPAKRNRARVKRNFNFSDSPRQVAYIYGADMMLPRALFEQMDGFDRDFFMYAEEAELSWRITRAGYQICSVPAARILHYDGASVKGSDDFRPSAYRMRQVGTMTYYEKCFGPQGPDLYTTYKRRLLKRQVLLAKLLRRHKLLELASRQLSALEAAAREYKQGRI